MLQILKREYYSFKVCQQMSLSLIRTKIWKLSQWRHSIYISDVVKIQYNNKYQIHTLETLVRILVFQLHQIKTTIALACAGYNEFIGACKESCQEIFWPTIFCWEIFYWLIFCWFFFWEKSTIVLACTGYDEFIGACKSPVD